jgi:hypothetical protein
MACGLCGWLVWKAGWDNINMKLGGVKFEGWDALPVMLLAIALVVSYFSGPMLNFGDFPRYGRSFDAVKRGNFWGLPLNFVFFSLLTVVTTAATLPVNGELIRQAQPERAFLLVQIKRWNQAPSPLARRCSPATSRMRSSRCLTSSRPCSCKPVNVRLTVSSFMPR